MLEIEKKCRLQAPYDPRSKHVNKSELIIKTHKYVDVS